MINSLYNFDNSRAKKRRYQKTLDFIQKGIQPPATVFDLGTPNAFSEIMKQNGFTVINTKGEDLDENPEAIGHIEADVATAFEIFEHLLNPLGVLKAIKADKLIASIPLSLWFAKAYRNKNDRGISTFTNLKTGNSIGCWKKQGGKSCEGKSGRARYSFPAFGRCSALVRPDITL